MIEVQSFLWPDQKVLFQSILAGFILEPFFQNEFRETLIRVPTGFFQTPTRSFETATQAVNPEFLTMVPPK